GALAQDIIFIMLDTTRADSLEKLNLPNLQGIAKRGVIYKNAVSDGTYTLTSHASLFLNEKVIEHKKVFSNLAKLLNGKNKISIKKMTLADKLAAYGYNTALISNNLFLNVRNGLAQGFNYVDNVFVNKRLVKWDIRTQLILDFLLNKRLFEFGIKSASGIIKLIPNKQRNALYLKSREVMSKAVTYYNQDLRLDKGANLTNSLVRQYADKNKDNKNFIFINYMETHEGYPVADVPQDKWLYMAGIYDNENIRKLKDAYNKRFVYLDKKIGQLLQILKTKGLLEDAELIIAGDHAQAFMEHNELYHGLFPYEEITNIPLITAKFINSKQVSQRKEVYERVALSDLHDAILNTVYGFELEIKPKEKTVYSMHTKITEQDFQLLNLLKGKIKYANMIYKAKQKYNKFALAVYQNDYKLIHYFGRQPDELYNLSVDKAETENLFFKEREISHRMLNAI
ncbi:MAG: sulfatase-like hydrolase/transferase, partial [Candidatus Parvarchaeota archaeon]